MNSLCGRCDDVTVRVREREIERERVMTMNLGLPVSSSKTQGTPSDVHGRPFRVGNLC